MRLLTYIIVLLTLAACGGGGGGGGSSAPAQPSSTAVNDQATVEEESSVSVDVLANDNLVDESTLSVSRMPDNGTASVENNKILYTPDPDFSGSDSFSYSVNGDSGSNLSATVTVTVTDINDAPVSVADSFTIVEDNPLTLSLDANDSDIDGTITGYEITGSFPGEVTGSGTVVVYTPPTDFVGQVNFEYKAVDDDGALSDTSAVVITVEPVSLTLMEVTQLQVPGSNYVFENDAELGADVLTSPVVEFLVPPNVISVLVTLNGLDANIDEGGLFISDLTPPSGAFVSLQRFVNFCFDGNCSSLVPRSPAFTAESGVWRLQLGTLSTNLDAINLDGLTLTAVFRTGPLPDLTQNLPASFTLKPHLTAASISAAELAPALTRLVEIAATNNIEVLVDPIEVIADAQFSSVSASFLDATTISLVSQGGPDIVNVFFLEDFAGGDSLGGITGGVPGSFGSMNGNNGVLINVGTLLADGSAISIQETAEATFHEMGHLLGLFHTTEARFSFVDVIDDTPFCDQAVHDANNDGVANALECPDAANPMFWFNSALFETEELTDDQKHVLFYSPIAVPGGT